MSLLIDTSVKSVHLQEVLQISTFYLELTNHQYQLKMYGSFESKSPCQSFLLFSPNTYYCHQLSIRDSVTLQEVFKETIKHLLKPANILVTLHMQSYYTDHNILMYVVTDTHSIIYS